MKDSSIRCGAIRQESSKGSKAPRSKMTRWRMGFLIGIHLLFALHLAHWKTTGRTMTPLEPSEAMEFSKRSVINAGFIFFAITILSTLAFGRFFCGWACHLVFVQDLCAGLMKRFGITPRPLRSRSLAFAPFLAAGYLFFWPFVERAWLGVHDMEPTLHLETSKFWATFPGLMIGILTFVVAGGAVVYFLGSKGFCTYACPYGAFFNVADRLAPARIRVNDDCERCGQCTVACTSNVAVAAEVHRYGTVVNPDCLKCLDCISVCPKDALRIGLGKPSIAVRSKQKRRPRFTPGYEFLLTFGFISAFLVFRGLYGRIPFLLALGLAGCSAYLLLRGVQLWTQPKVSIPPFQLKSENRITSAGKGYAFLMLGMISFFGHSAWIHSLDVMSQRAYAPLIPVRAEWFTPARPEITDKITAAAKLVIRRSNKVLEFGLFETPRCRVERAWASMILGDTDTFTADMAVAAALAPSDVNTLVEPAHNLRASGQVEASIPLYLDAARRDPDEVQTMRFLIDASLQVGQLQVAIDHLKAQVTKRAWDSVAHEHLGIAFLRAKRMDEALTSFEQALAHATDAARQQRITVQLARMHLEGGRPAQAKGVLIGGREQLPDDMHLVFVLAQVLSADDDPAGAIEVLLEGLAIEPQNERLQGLLAQLRNQIGR
ncbi:MAG: tetratricopeptide repeat protein [bacterium]|nr:tetratricopeptide repeat protein [bacterium]